MLPIEEQTIICSTCGSDTWVESTLAEQRCKICEDPRQYLPASGQKWTTWKGFDQQYHNVIRRLDPPARTPVNVWSIHTEPKFAIGQRCFLITTTSGNILWDCITLIDEATTRFIRSMGGLKAIVISHPHYYTSHLTWARVFECPVYIAWEDKPWCTMPDRDQHRRSIVGKVEQILPQIQAIKLGGHFPGSLVLRYQPSKPEEALLFIADTIKVSPSGLSPEPRPYNMSSFNFMWSYPNAIPLPPATLHHMWTVLEEFEFGSVHGAFANEDIWAADVKKRVLESMHIQTAYMGYTAATADILKVGLPR